MNASDAPCRDAGSGVDFSNCVFRAWQQRDQEVEQLYRRIEHVMDGQERGELAKAQAQWLAYRKTTCETEYSEYGSGTGGPPARSACYGALARGRIKDLRDGFGWLVEKRKP
jgi:uncharacterized protein YecT (DUF1311 family)